jgi:hypothetical protein
MGKRRGFREAKPDEPLLRPMTSNEVLTIMRAGGIDFDRNAKRFLADALEEVRQDFLNELAWKELRMTDLQLTDRLTEARNKARQLLTLLDDGALAAQATVLALEGRRTGNARRAADKKWNVPDIEPLEAIVHWADGCLSALKRRQAHTPNFGAGPSANQGGLGRLAVKLATVWRSATGKEEPSCARGSSMIPFLRVGMEIIRQRAVSMDGARYWARFAVKYYFA